MAGILTTVTVGWQDAGIGLASGESIGNGRAMIVSCRPLFRFGSARSRLSVLAGALLGLSFWGSDTASADKLRTDLPIACVPGVDCLIQNYPDVDPTKTASDHACGEMTYDGHSGTDFRIPDLQAMKRGVAVKAAAAGIIKRVRDGVLDNPIGKTNISIPDDKACGNGVVIDHGDGWSTQYCHLRNGSVQVKPGQTVLRGTALAKVGMSGKTVFPHLHFSVRKGETVLDPFTRLSLEAGCGADGASLWTDATTFALAYRSAAILNTGFSPGSVDNRDIETARHAGFRLNVDSPALVFYGRSVGLVAGDVEVIEIRGPGGLLISHAGAPLERAMAEKYMFAGRKIPKAGWRKGLYTGIYRVIRSGQIVSEAVETMIYE